MYKWSNNRNMLIDIKSKKLDINNEWENNQTEFSKKAAFQTMLILSIVGEFFFLIQVNINRKISEILVLNYSILNIN